MERLLARLELRYGRYAPGNLTYILVGLQALVFVLNMLHPGFSGILTLNTAGVMHGEVWRLVTYLVVPMASSPLWEFLGLYWLYIMGTALESEWGAFRYALYWFVGALGTTAFAFGMGIPADNTYLVMSLFLAFATLWPDYKILVLFVLPVPVKWLALLDAVGLLVTVGMLQGPQRALPILAVGNYFLFFTPTLARMLRGGVRQAGRARALHRYRRVVTDTDTVRDYRNRKCSLCGVTSLDDPTLEFRVCTCAKCMKPTEFCLQHAREH